jgi:PAS domain S-box-containing protein
MDAVLSNSAVTCEPIGLYQDLVETSPVLMWQCDREGRYTYLNPIWEEIFGYKRDEMLGKKFTCFQTPETAARDSVEFERLFSGNLMNGFETTHIGKAGQQIHLVLNAKSVVNADGSVIGIRGTAFDISGMNQTIRMLMERESLYYALFSASPMLLALLRIRDNCIVDVNRKFLRATGWTEKEVIGKYSHDLGVFVDLEERMQPVDVDALPQGGTSKSFEMEFKKKDLTTLPVLASSEIIDIADESCLLISAIDISARKKVEASLTRSEFLMRTAIENLPIIFYMIDREGIFRLAVGAGLNGPGLDHTRLVGQSAFEIYRDLPEITAAFTRALAGERTSFEAEVAGMFFFSICVPVDGWFDGIVVAAMNITERKRTEDALQKFQKLESLGILAGGIAHDFNNLLGAIFGYIDLARDATQEASTRKYLDAIMGSMGRARGLTHQLLTFAKGGAPVRKIISIRSFIQDTVQFALSGSAVSSQFRISDDLWPCDVDKNQIGQVIDNIVINAQQAMPTGGTVDIRAVNLVLQKNEHPILKEGNYVQIVISDSGIGIPPEIQPRIFDPFFTTKSKGHGLGLATSYSILKRHGGTLEVTSRQGEGSAFTIFLPAVKEDLNNRQNTVLRHQGKGTIIVADDEEGMKIMIGQMLETFGYTVVLHADCGTAAQAFLSDNNRVSPVAALIFDLTIPGGIGGLEAASEIRKHNAAIPIIAISGYSDDPVMVTPTAYGFSGSLAKPFRTGQLSKLLNDVICSEQVEAGDSL